MANTLETLTAPVPKVISPTMHAVADYSTVAALVAMGARLRDRNTTASTFAFANAGMVLMTSLMTDYPGGVTRGISFKTHGMIDMLQGAMLALGPVLLGFADTDDARLFYGQAALEMGVVAATDWDAA
jgi:hypothetical protein